MLEKLKILLDIEGEDLDEKLKLLISNATARLKMLLGGIDIPTELDYIILEAAVVRFNRIGSEGLASHTVEGESLTFASGDFDAFSDDIQAYLDSIKGNPDKGGFKFI